MGENGLLLVRRVADAAVVCEGDPSVRPDNCQPLGVRRSGREVVRVALDMKAGVPEYRRKLIPEIAVREVNGAHAARSNSTASLTASMLIS